MTDRELVVAAVGKKKEIAEMLDRNLGPHDQAWVVCDYNDCEEHVEGRCTIYMVHDVPKMIQGRPCSSYRPRL